MVSRIGSSHPLMLAISLRSCALNKILALGQGFRYSSYLVIMVVLVDTATMSGSVSSEDFISEDRKRDLSVVRFESQEALKYWRTQPEHAEAQRLAREL